MLEISDSLRNRFQDIQMVVTDVDGVLTDGKIIYDDQGIEYKHFNVKDGLIVKRLKRLGIIVGVITGRDSPVVRKRCEELKFDFHFHGVKDKKQVLSEELDKRGLEWKHVLYIGDDINDIELINQCAIGCVPKDVPMYMATEADIISSKKGGEGVYRELADLLIFTRGWMDKMLRGEI